MANHPQNYKLRYGTALIVKSTIPDMPRWAGGLKSLTAEGILRLTLSHRAVFSGFRSLKAKYQNLARWNANAKGD
jgi:hypothetical protein